MVLVVSLLICCRPIEKRQQWCHQRHRGVLLTCVRLYIKQELLSSRYSLCSHMYGRPTFLSTYCLSHIMHTCLCCRCYDGSCTRTPVGHTRKSVHQLLNAAVSCSMKFDQRHASNMTSMLLNLPCWELRPCLAGNKLYNGSLIIKQSIKVCVFIVVTMQHNGVWWCQSV